MLRRCLPAAVLVAFASPGLAGATSSSPAAASPMAGNGHNVTFDGRVFIVTQGPTDATGGWFAMVFRPENVRYAAGGRLDLSQGAFTPPVQVQPWQNGENALAICEAAPDSTPYKCDDAGSPSDAGPFHCYDLAVLDSNAFPNQVNSFRRRTLKLWLQAPGTPEAAYYKHQWIGGMEPLLSLADAPLRGIEMTATRDGKLIVWQGHPDNDGKIDILMYATNPTPCGTTGWDGPHNLSHLYNDPKIVGTYALGERQLRAADGVPFADGALVHGAYPWLFPDGDALTFMATVMPCKGPEDPPGCGARRNALSVIGYPTNWGVAHVDGELNPSTQHSVRLFFSSPGRDGFPQLPLTGGKDVWPLFGSNTGNQADVVFDDGLDGNYAGVWHMNESVNVGGDLDLARTPDTSGYYNTGAVQGAAFPADNNGLFGKALQFDGQGAIVEVPHSDTLAPVNALSVEMWIRPDAPVDCDAQNNYRLLLGKGNIPGPYSLVFEEGEVFQARVRAGGVERAAFASKGAPVGQWSHVGFTYDGGTGALRVFLNGEQVGAHDGPADRRRGRAADDRRARRAATGLPGRRRQLLRGDRRGEDLAGRPRPDDRGAPRQRVAVRQSGRPAAGRGGRELHGDVPPAQRRHHRVGAGDAAPPRQPGADGQRHVGDRPRRARRPRRAGRGRRGRRHADGAGAGRRVPDAVEAGPRGRGVVRRADAGADGRGRTGGDADDDEHDRRADDVGRRDRRRGDRRAGDRRRRCDRRRRGDRRDVDADDVRPEHRRRRRAARRRGLRVPQRRGRPRRPRAARPARARAPAQAERSCLNGHV